MEHTMIRVNKKTHRLLKGLAGLNGVTLSEMLEKMVSFWTENTQAENSDLFKGVPIRRYSKEDIDEIVRKEDEAIERNPEGLKKAERLIAKARNK